MRRVVVALGTAALLAIVLVVAQETYRTTSRGERDAESESARAGPDVSPEEEAASNLPDEPSRRASILGPGEIAVRVLDVGTHRTVADLEVSIGSRYLTMRTNDLGVAAWDGVKPGWLAIEFPDRRYVAVEGQSSWFEAALACRLVTVCVERLTTLRLRFAHDDGTPVGEVLANVTVEARYADAARQDDGTPHDDWHVRTGSRAHIEARCEDGYEAAADVLCDSWPVDERTIHLRSVAPRGRATLRFEVVAAESGEPIADAGVGYCYRFGTHRWRKGVTDKEGTAFLGDLPTAATALVCAWAGGRHQAGEDVKLEPGSAGTLRLSLARAGPAIRGACNRPHATVLIMSESRAFQWSKDLEGEEFAFTDLDPGTYTVTASEGGDSVGVSTVAGGPPLPLTFPPRGTLVLDIRDADGRVPESIDVKLERDGADTWRNGITPEDGRFRLLATEGPVAISISAAGYRRTPATSVHVVGDALNEMTIPLGHPLPILDVLVIDPSGAPVPGVPVLLWVRDDDFMTIAHGLLNPWSTWLDGSAQFVRELEEPTEFEIRLGGMPGTTVDTLDGDPLAQAVRMPTTGRVTATIVGVPRPRVVAKSQEESPPAPLLAGDLLVEWNGWPLRLAVEIPRRWAEPVAVTVLRDGKELDLTLPPMERNFDVRQALLPPP